MSKCYFVCFLMNKWKDRDNKCLFNIFCPRSHSQNLGSKSLVPSSVFSVSILQVSFFILMIKSCNHILEITVQKYFKVSSFTFICILSMYLWEVHNTTHSKFLIFPGSSYHYSFSFRHLCGSPSDPAVFLPC